MAPAKSWHLPRFISQVYGIALMLCTHQISRCYSSFVTRRPTRYRQSLSASAPTGTNVDDVQKIAIVGGGLAGLGTAFHLLNIAHNFRKIDLTIFDRTNVGEGGASAVAGGLLHPLSPRGKLIHLGLEGLAATNVLVEVAAQFAPNVILRNELYRVAISPQQVDDLQASARMLPEMCEWLASKPPAWDEDISNDCALGAIRLFDGPKVVHTPSYLQGLWRACQQRAGISNNQCTWHRLYHGDLSTIQSGLTDFDVVVLAAGAGLWQDNMLARQHAPVQFVRGQSVEVQLTTAAPSQAVLCGKYVSPLPAHGMVLVGATHEFADTPWQRNQVIEELRHRTEGFAPQVWQQGEVKRVTSGMRVQSERGKHGRLPIIGRVPASWLMSLEHKNAWIFSGLSSRGLLYHALYGSALGHAILTNSESVLLERLGADAFWWKSA